VTSGCPILFYYLVIFVQQKKEKNSFLSLNGSLLKASGTFLFFSILFSVTEKKIINSFLYKFLGYFFDNG